MLKPEHVPEAVALVLDQLVDSGELWTSKDAIVAALNAWPGMTHIIEGDPGRENAEIILPLPKENTNG